MAKMQLEMTVPAGASQQLAEQIKKQLGQMVWNRFLLRSKPILDEVGNMLAARFLQTDVAVALLHPTGDNDCLVGHLGLTHELAKGLCDGMQNLIRNSVKASPGNGEIVVQIKAVAKDWDAYRALPGAAYISKPSGRTIPVVDWLLVNPNIDVGQAEYDIAWKGEWGKASNFRNSRSGYAIMVHEKKWGQNWHGPWVLPTWVHSVGGKNFIEYALGQEGVAKEVLAIVTKQMR